MIFQQTRVSVGVKGLAFASKEFRRIDSGDRKGLGDVFEQFADEYFKYLYQRYLRLRSGGGEWPPLKRRTLQWRKSIGTANKAIFNVTQTLANAIKPGRGRPGHYQRRTRNSIFCGIGGPGRHPLTGGSIRALALKHARGNPANKLPVRRLVVVPSPRVQRNILRIIRKRTSEIIADANSKESL